MTAQPQAEPFDAVEVIRTKRDRGTLSPEQIDWVVDAYTRGVVADEQMSALAMAILLNGMDRAEIARWTDAMIASGERMDFGGLTTPDGRPLATADKHSTGGVGDKITLPLAPLVGGWWPWAGWVVIGAATVLTVLTGLEYVKDAWVLRRDAFAAQRGA